MRYTTLLFDVDGTLLDFDAAEETALQRIFAMHPYPCKEEMLRHYLHLNGRLWGLYENGEIERDSVLRTRFAILFQELHTEGDGLAFEKAYQQELSKEHELMPHALQVIQRLHKVCCLNIVTNGFVATQYPRLKDSGLDRYFDKIFVSEEIGYQKPDVGFFTYCFEHLPQATKEQTLLIGDSLISDMLGARNAGIASCWFNPYGEKNSKEIPVTYEIQDLRELYAILDIHEE